MATVLLAGTATAFWTAGGSGTAAAVTSTLRPPTAVTVPANSYTDVPVSWTASTGVPSPTGYFVTRTRGGVTVAACGTSADALILGASCTDTAVADGSYVYRVTAVYRTWTAVSNASGTVAVATPTKVVFGAGPTNTVAGASMSAVTVSVQTASGANVPEAGIPVTVSIAANPEDGTLSGTLTHVTNSSGVATFGDLSVDLAGSGYTLLATSPGLTSATSSSFAISAAVAARFVITSAPVSGIASSTASLGPITIGVVDAFGNTAVAPAGGLTASLASNTTGSRIFSASLLGSPITTIAIPAGAAGVSFYYGDTKAGSPVITVSGTMGSGTQTQTIIAAAPTRFMINSAPVNGVASTTANLGPITIGLRDAFLNVAIAPAGGVTATLASTSGGTKVFAATAGGSQITTISILAGSPTVNFYYGDNRAGTPLVTVSGPLTTATQSQTIVPASVSQLVITSSATSGIAAAAATLGPITVESRDAFGNAVVAPAGGTVVALSSNSTGAAVFATSLNGSAITSVTIPAGSANTSFYYGDTKSGSPTITATSTGLTAAQQVQSVLAGVATQLAITSSAVSGPASATASLGAIIIRPRDVYANLTTAPAGGIVVNLASNSTGTVIFAASSGGTGVSTVTIPAGSSQVIAYYGDTKSGSPTITASATGLTAGSQVETITGAAPSQFIITTAPITAAASATANGGPITIGLRDTFGNSTVAPTGGIVATLGSNTAGTRIFSNALNGSSVTTRTIPANMSSVNFYYGDTRAGTPTITVSGTITSATQVETVTAAAPSQFVFTSAALSGAASATATLGPATIGLRDAFGNTAVAPGGGTSVTLASNSTGTKVFAATSGGASITTTTIAAGTSSVNFYYGDTKVGSPTITASGTLTSATQGQTIVAGAASKLVFVQNPANTARAAVMTPPLTVAVQDLWGNATTSTASITISIGNNGGTLALGVLYGTKTVNAVAGVATFSTLYIDGLVLGLGAIGTGYTLEARATGLTTGTSTTFAIT